MTPFETNLAFYISKVKPMVYKLQIKTNGSL